MKTGLNLQELAAELERRHASKKDYIVNSKSLEMVADSAVPGGIKLSFNGENVGINRIAHAQIAEVAGIPKPYYDRMLAEEPLLLSDNVNKWFRKYPEVRMLRTLDGLARALPSDKFRPLENEDLAQAVLPVAIENGLEVMSSQITESRLYIKLVDRQVVRDLANIGGQFGDGKHKILRTVSPAITISNSEVGMGALSILGGVYDGFCSNLATFGERSLRKYHVGARHELGTDQIAAMLSDDTRRKTDVAIWAQVRDVVKGAFDRAKFDALVDKIEGTAEDKIEGDLVKVISLSTKKFGLTETEGKSILTHLAEGGSLTRFGLFNAVTRAAQDVEDYDRASELERIGGNIIDLPRTEWSEVLKQAA